MVESRNTIKGWFETGDFPTAEQFAAWIDSVFHLNEDKLAADKVTYVREGILNAKQAFDALYLSIANVTVQDATTTQKGIVQLSDTPSTSSTLAATPKQVDVVKAGLEEYVNTRITQLLATAPEALDTLKELADAIGNDANFAGTITTILAAKAERTELNAYQLNSQKGAAGGYAGLDENAKIPLVNLPEVVGNGKVVVSATDTVQDFIKNKFQAGSNITITVANSGSNEYLIISSTGGESNAAVWGSITGTLSNQTDLQALLDLKLSTSQKGAVNGLATLDLTGVVPLDQIPASIKGGLNLKGAWNANTNSPALASNVGTKGDLYIITTAGNTSLNGLTGWKIGDSVFFDGAAWQRISGQSITVASVFGRIGAITAQTGDYNADQITETANRKFVNAIQLNIINNISGTNTGDETKATIETKLLSSTLSTIAKTIVAAINELFSGKANKVATPTVNRMVKTDANGHPVQCTFTDVEIVQLAAIDMSAVPEEGIVILTAKKEAGTGNTIFQGGADTVDVFVSSDFNNLLSDAQAWVGDSLTITGNNLTFGLGQVGQRHWLNGHAYTCTSSTQGTTTINGSSVWKRTLGNSCLDGTRDAALIAAMVNATYNSDNAAIITTRCRVGSWYTAGSGYEYSCYAESGTNWYIRRSGLPTGIDIQISDATLKTEIEAHNFTTTPILSPVAAIKGDQGQIHVWEAPAGTANKAECVLISTNIRWIKIK